MKVLTDEVEDHPVLGFEPYADCLVDIIRDTNPRLSIGIYGEWGTGKTTLMELIKNKLTDENSEILTVWFNAWRYEREENYAITALMKSIAYAMVGHRIYDEMAPAMINTLKVVVKGIAQGLAAKFLGNKDIADIKQEDIFPYVEFLTKFDKDTIYFDGIHNIEEEMKKIWEKYPKSRIVVFIDDLDRCSPKRTL